MGIVVVGAVFVDVAHIPCAVNDFWISSVQRILNIGFACFFWIIVIAKCN